MDHKGTNPNLQNPLTGQTALHLLCQHAEPLLKRPNYNWEQPNDQLGTDPNQVIILLIRKGADPTIKDHNGVSCVDIVPFLLGNEDQ